MKTWERVLVSATLWLAGQGVASAESPPPRLDELEAALSREARLSWMVTLARTRSPVLAESDARARATRMRAEGAGSLPEPELKAELWAVPLARPYALDRANMWMFGVRQSFPAAGTRQDRARSLAADADVSEHARRATERELVYRLRSAYLAYYEAERALQIHGEHVALTEQMVAQVRDDYEAGRGSQEALLSALTELSRLHTSVASERQQHATSRYLLNTLMGRATDAPLGPAPALRHRSDEAASAAALEAALPSRRPELAGARSTVRRAEAVADAARHAARRPAFMVGADYFVMPTMMDPHAYGAMVSMSLPWLSAERRAEARAAAETLQAERHAAEATHASTRFALHQALAGLEAARTSYTLLEREVLPQVTRGLEASESAFSRGQGGLLALLEARRSYYQVRLEHSRAEARLLAQLAELELSAGAPAFDVTEQEVAP